MKKPSSAKSRKPTARKSTRGSAEKDPWVIDYGDVKSPTVIAPHRYRSKANSFPKVPFKDKPTRISLEIDHQVVYSAVVPALVAAECAAMVVRDGLGDVTVRFGATTGKLTKLRPRASATRR